MKKQRKYPFIKQNTCFESRDWQDGICCSSNSERQACIIKFFSCEALASNFYQDIVST